MYPRSIVENLVPDFWDIVLVVPFFTNRTRFDIFCDRLNMELSIKKGVTMMSQRQTTGIHDASNVVTSY